MLSKKPKAVNDTHCVNIMRRFFRISIETLITIIHNLVHWNQLNCIWLALIGVEIEWFDKIGIFLYSKQRMLSDSNSVDLVISVWIFARMHRETQDFSISIQLVKQVSSCDTK